MPSVPASTPTRRASLALQAVSFFMADMQAGIGPFLGVFLQQHGWTTGRIGTVMTVGGFAGMAMTAPAGALVDHSKKKRIIVVASGLCTIVASFAILLSQATWVVATGEMAEAIAGAAVGPAMVGMTLGIARHRGFNAQNGRNQAWDHAGNMVGAGLSGLLGWKFGLPAIFFLTAAYGVLAIVSVLLIPAAEIDHRAARGLEDRAQDAQPREASSMRSLVQNRPLLVLAATLAFFHLGSGAMVSLYGLAVVGAGKGNAASFVAEIVLVAQGVMLVASLLAMRMSHARGYWVVLLISFMLLPIRGVLAGLFITPWGVWPVQTLDGIATGLQCVAVPGLITSLLHGSGRVNVGQGALMTVQGLGSTLSPAVGGWLAQWLGYRPAFFILGSFALASIALWIVFAPMLRAACEAAQGDAETT